MAMLPRFLLICAAFLALPTVAAAVEAVTVSPTRGPVGQSVTVTGSGWLTNAGEGVFLFISEIEVATAYPDANGSFSVSFVIPTDIPEGVQTISGHRGFSSVADAYTSFTVTASPPPDPPDPSAAPIRIDRVFTHLAGSSPWDREQSIFTPGDADAIEFLLVLDHLSTHNLRHGATINVRRRPSNTVLYTQRFPPRTCMQAWGHWCTPGLDTYYFNIYDVPPSRAGIYDISWSVTIGPSTSIHGTYSFSVTTDTTAPPPPDPVGPISISKLGNLIDADADGFVDVPPGQAPNLIVLVHGCCTDSDDIDKKVWNPLAKQIRDAIVRRRTPGAWEIVVWDWHDATPKHSVLEFIDDAIAAYDNVVDNNLGSLLADAVETHQYDYIHFIAHSAGSGLIQAAAEELAVFYRNSSEKPFIQLTFLDALTLSDNDTNRYGSLPHDHPHYSEHYVDRDPAALHTNALLTNAFNFNITRWHNKPAAEALHIGHLWPRNWYKRSVTRSGFSYGFPLSGEGGKRVEALDRGYPPGWVCKIETPRDTCVPNEVR